MGKVAGVCEAAVAAIDSNGADGADSLDGTGDTDSLDGTGDADSLDGTGGADGSSNERSINPLSNSSSGPARSGCCLGVLDDADGLGSNNSLIASEYKTRSRSACATRSACSS